MTYGYVCTNYNNAHFTVRAVESLQEGVEPPRRIVVVDNASAASDVEQLTALAARFAHVELVLNPQNLGYFPGLNVGIRRIRALESGFAPLVVGNNDLEFPAEFGTQLRMLTPELTDKPVISPDIVTLDGVHQNPHVIAGISRPREFIYDVYYANYRLAGLIRKAAQWSRRLTDRSDETQHAHAQYIYQGHGSCYVLMPSFFDFFDELWAPTFLMGEEFFLSRQLAEQGKKVYYEPRLTLRHRCNGAIENVPSRRMWELARDAHRVYRRYVKPWRKQGA